MFLFWNAVLNAAFSAALDSCFCGLNYSAKRSVIYFKIELTNFLLIIFIIKKFYEDAQVMLKKVKNNPKR